MDAALHLVLRLRGGGGPDFVDVTRTDALTQQSWSKSAPDWRVVGKGLCLEGRCTNTRCDAYGHMVIVNKGFNNFDFVASANSPERRDCLCPVCYQPVVPVKPGFNNCMWKVAAVKMSSPESIFNKPWTKAGDQYTTYDDVKAGTSTFSRLQIFVKELPETFSAPGVPAVSAAALQQEYCAICIERFERPPPSSAENVPTAHTSGCGHIFHSGCVRKWSSIQKAHGHTLSCPLCRAE